MQHTVSDLTVSVEHAFDAHPVRVWETLLDPSMFERTAGSVESLERVPREPPPADAGTQPAAPSPTPSPTSSSGPATAGETFVGDLDVSVDGMDLTFETYLTVQACTYPRLVVAGGGDADRGSFDTHVVVAIAAVEDGTVVRLDAQMDVAGEITAAGVEPVRAGMARGIERYFSGVERALAAATYRR